ncbi:hypothetical protein M758_9G035300 [Ceratodon purpureus]|uniref:Methyltransferase type 11 domain-containing protein n=1 Tax=Ceratodon purpureus TaxID=3225 RepID=A0A8T0GQ48_CERPU|nr:hypothetical protein KC19_9G032700 [Ceratodon purpureus]KAG0605150.1 hypothetical protein M758_9G035300 [Ceratodon purpureus]
MGTQWDGLATDFNSGVWLVSYCQQPFWEGQYKKLAEERSGGPWTVLDVGCGTGSHTVRTLQAGASYVLAFDVSKDMVEKAKLEVDKFFQSQALPESKVDCVVASVTDCSSIPEAQEGTFDLAVCGYVLCNLGSKDEIRQALKEIYKLLKPGGKLMISETHVIQYTLEWDNESVVPLLYKWCTPKEDGTKWNYFEDEGKPRELRMRMNSGREIKVTNRLYTLSTWVSLIVEAGFQITQFLEPYVDSKAIPADAPDYMKYAAGKPTDMFWECTKPNL